MNKKGFTLVELLAVITILGIITTIAVVSLNGVREKVDLKTIEGNLDLIMISARRYGDDHLSELYDDENGQTKTVSELKGLTELEIDDEYNSLNVTIKMEGRRAIACFNRSEESKFKNNLKIPTENMSDFNRFFCS